MSRLKELPEDYWDRQAKQNILLKKLRKLKRDADEQKQILLARR